MRFTLKQLKNSTAKIASTSDGKPLTSPARSSLSFKVTAPAAAGREKQPTPIRANGGMKLGRRLTPHQILWLAIQDRWPGMAVCEFEGAVPGRKFRIDIAFPEHRLALESDGWAYHGRFLGDFVRDRERQNLLCIHGWRVLRFSAGMVRRNLDEQLRLIDIALAATASHASTRGPNHENRTSKLSDMGNRITLAFRRRPPMKIHK